MFVWTAHVNIVQQCLMLAQLNSRICKIYCAIPSEELSGAITKLIPSLPERVLRHTWRPHGMALRRRAHASAYRCCSACINVLGEACTLLARDSLALSQLRNALCSLPCATACSIPGHPRVYSIASLSSGLHMRISTLNRDVRARFTAAHAHAPPRLHASSDSHQEPNGQC